MIAKRKYVGVKGKLSLLLGHILRYERRQTRFGTAQHVRQSCPLRSSLRVLNSVLWGSLARYRVSRRV
jgi:hypothetical protein